MGSTMSGITRRAAIKTTIGVAAAFNSFGAHSFAEPENIVPFFKKTGFPIGVQLYALGPDLAWHLDAQLAELAEAGVGEVELAGYLGRKPAELKRALDLAGLKCPSAHISTRRQNADPDLDSRLSEVIEDAHALGAEYVVVPFFYIPDRFAAGPAAGEDVLGFIRRVTRSLTLDDWKRSAEFANRTATALHAAGLKFAYHNHNPEFAPIDGTTGFEILVRETDADLVKFEMDAGWVFAAGKDPVSVLQAHPGRFRMIHVKDVKATTKTNFEFAQDPTEVGSGVMDWPSILPAAQAAGVTHFYVEQEPPYTSLRMTSVRKSVQFLQDLVAK
jgi:sugar phosphate isomerase/epimerase